MRKLLLCALLYGMASAAFAEPTDLHTAARVGNLTAIEKALEEGTDINTPDPNSGLTPWQQAQVSGRKEAAEMLATAGADTTRAFPEPAVLLDRYLADQVVENGPGCSVLVSQDGKILFEKGYGLADIEAGKPMTKESVSRIGSVTKQFTATAILLLAEDGKLSVEDPISKFYPGFPRGETITLHHLLTHTSGIKSYTDVPSFLDTVTEARTPEEMIAIFRDLMPDFQPGEGFHYCNSGYYLLGDIVRQVSGKPYYEFLDERVFQPLGMKTTGAHRPGLELEQEAKGYERVKPSVQEWKPSLDWHMSQAGGAGEIYSTVGDLYRWNEGIFNGKVLKEETLKAAFTPVGETRGGSPLSGLGDTYGYGWAITQQRGLRQIQHSGGLHGFTSHLVRYPDQKLTIAVLTNSSEPPPGFGPGLVSDIASQIFLWRDMDEQPSFREDDNLPAEKLQEFTGTFDFPGVAVMRFRVHEGKLQGLFFNQAWNDLANTAEDQYELPEVGAKFRFGRDEKGKIQEVTLDQRGMTLKGPRFAEPEEGELTKEQKEALVGDYDLTPLGIFTVRLAENGRILAKLGQQMELPFFPVENQPDRLFAKAVRAELEFLRGEDDAISGVVLHQAGAEFKGSRAAE